MEHPIVEKILLKGIKSVNLGMLDAASRERILKEVGEKLFKQGKFTESIEIMALAGQMDKLISLGDDFMSQGKADLAAQCYIPTKDKQRLNDAAVKCIQSKNYSLAAKAYDAAENHQMSSFIKTNFSE
ncbi:MAG TPA: hypothetical protein VI564_00115 [Candidatus Nanoarchaeia archaeon]|nr:hypothetical protein [Candidatus Nanoarchaeia archaeon]